MRSLIPGIEPCPHDKTDELPPGELTIRMCGTHGVWIRAARCTAYAPSRRRRCLGVAVAYRRCKRHQVST